MKKKEIKEQINHYKQKKFPFTKKYFERQFIVDKEEGYSGYDAMSVWECLGLPFKKVISRKSVKMVKVTDDAENVIINGFKNAGFRESDK